MYKDLSKTEMEIMFGKAEEMWQESKEMKRSDYDHEVAKMVLYLKDSAFTDQEIEDHAL